MIHPTLYRSIGPEGHLPPGGYTLPSTDLLDQDTCHQEATPYSLQIYWTRRTPATRRLHPTLYRSIGPEGHLPPACYTLPSTDLLDQKDTCHQHDTPYPLQIYWTRTPATRRLHPTLYRSIGPEGHLPPGGYTLPSTDLLDQKDTCHQHATPYPLQIYWTRRTPATRRLHPTLYRSIGPEGHLPPGGYTLPSTDLLDQKDTCHQEATPYPLQIYWTRRTPATRRLHPTLYRSIGPEGHLPPGGYTLPSTGLLDQKDTCHQEATPYPLQIYWTRRTPATRRLHPTLYRSIGPEGHLPPGGYTLPSTDLLDQKDTCHQHATPYPLQIYWTRRTPATRRLHPTLYRSIGPEGHLPPGGYTLPSTDLLDQKDTCHQHATPYPLQVYWTRRTPATRRLHPTLYRSIGPEGHLPPGGYTLPSTDLLDQKDTCHQEATPYPLQIYWTRRTPATRRLHPTLYRSIGPGHLPPGGYTLPSTDLLDQDTCHQEATPYPLQIYWTRRTPATRRLHPTLYRSIGPEGHLPPACYTLPSTDLLDQDTCHQHATPYPLQIYWTRRTPATRRLHPTLYRSIGPEGHLPPGGYTLPSTDLLDQKDTCHQEATPYPLQIYWTRRTPATRRLHPTLYRSIGPEGHLPPGGYTLPSTDLLDQDTCHQEATPYPLQIYWTRRTPATRRLHPTLYRSIGPEGHLPPGGYTLPSTDLLDQKDTCHQEATPYPLQVYWTRRTPATRRLHPTLYRSIGPEGHLPPGGYTLPSTDLLDQKDTCHQEATPYPLQIYWTRRTPATRRLHPTLYRSIGPEGHLPPACYTLPSTDLLDQDTCHQEATPYPLQIYWTRRTPATRRLHPTLYRSIGPEGHLPPGGYTLPSTDLLDQKDTCHQEATPYPLQIYWTRRTPATSMLHPTLYRSIGPEGHLPPGGYTLPSTDLLDQKDTCHQEATPYPLQIYWTRRTPATSMLHPTLYRSIGPEGHLPPACYTLPSTDLLDQKDTCHQEATPYPLQIYWTRRTPATRRLHPTLLQ